jgi:hypothetical protein
VVMRILASATTKCARSATAERGARSHARRGCN